MNDLLLLAMMLGSAKYGYQMRREAAWITGQESLHNNLVYPMLRRFLEEGWVSKKAVPGERGQTRQQYALTREGHRHLLERLSEFSEADASSEAGFRLRVGLFTALNPEVRSTILAQREKHLRNSDQKLAALSANIGMDKFGEEVIGHMRKQIATERDWIGRLRRIANTGRQGRRNA